MLNLINRSPHDVVKRIGADAYRTSCGLLTSTRSRHHPRHARAHGAKWAMDNNCFTGYDPHQIISALRAFAGIPNCLFFVAPDVWSDAASTLLLFRAWLGTIQRYGYPVAFVAQDGIEQTAIPWDSFTTLFIGGSNEFKYSTVCRDVCLEAKRRGKWIHHGRVNSIRRIRYSKDVLLCDSFDGTHYTRDLSDLHRHVAEQQVSYRKVIA